MLILILSLSFLVACSAPETLTKTTILGSWTGEMSLKDVLFVEASVPVEFEFTAEGIMRMKMDKDDIVDVVKNLLEEGDSAEGITGLSKDQLDQMSALTGKSVEALLEENLGLDALETSYSYRYFFDGTNLTLEGGKVDYRYENGILTITLAGQEIALEYEG